MIKKILSVSFIVLMFIFVPKSYAEPNVKVVVNGSPLVSDTAPMIINSRTMVPFRALFEALGANQIIWDEPTQTVIGSDGTTTIKLVLGSYDIEVNGTTITMDTPPMVMNGRTMIPLSMVSSNMGANVVWNASNYTVEVTKDGVSPIQNIANAQVPSISQPDINIQNPQTTKPIDIFNSGMNISSDTSQISGHYAVEDLKRNKYVLYLDASGKAELVDINSKAKVSGIYSYSNGVLSLNVANFNGAFTREDIKYNGNNILFMKDNVSPTSGSTFAMIKIVESEYNKYILPQQ